MNDSHGMVDDEWEYEYDDEQYEEHFITVDFTSRVPPEQRRNPPKVKRAKHDQPAFQSKEAATNDTSQRDASQPAQDNEEDKVADTIQIIGLHHQQPIIRYRDRTFACDWSTAIGTDMLFTLPSETDLPPSISPMRTNQDYNLIAATPHRLIARPINLVPKSSESDPALDEPQPAPQSRSNLAAGIQSESIRDSIHANPARAQQAAFMDKLTRIKRDRGERDTIPMHSKSSKDRPRTVIKSRLKHRGGTDAPDAAEEGNGEDDAAGESEDENAHRPSSSAAAAPDAVTPKPRGRGGRRKQVQTGDHDTLSMIVGDATPAGVTGGPGSRGGPGALGGTSHLRSYTLGMTRRSKARGESWRGGRPRLSSRNATKAREDAATEEDAEATLPSGTSDAEMDDV